jgi:hypothetical protein
MMAFIEGMLFSDKRKNLIVYEMLPADFLACIQETFIEGGSIMIRE